MRIWRLIFARQLVHSNIAREILHTVPEVFHIVPEIFHIVPEIFRIVPSQFLQFSDPRNGRDGFYGFYGSIFGHWRGMVDMWLYGATNWAGRALKRSRDTEAVWAWKTRFGICLVFGIEGHVDLIHGALLPCAVFSEWPPTATPRTSMMHFFHHWQEPTCRFVHVADDFHPTHILKGILGRLLWAILFWLYHWIMVITILCGRANAYIKTTFKARRTWNLQLVAFSWKFETNMFWKNYLDHR